jgi:hypothetical protein
MKLKIRRRNNIKPKRIQGEGTACCRKGENMMLVGGTGWGGGRVKTD